MSHRYLNFVILTVIGSFVICIPAFAANSVFVSILPQKYFLQKIGKDLVDVHVMVAPGASPATYEPKPLQMMALSRAQVYFAVGVPFERAWLKKIAAANPDMRIVHTDEGIEKIPMAAHHHEESPPMNAHKNIHGEEASFDPHVWLSPPLVKIQARHIYEALAACDPGHEAIYAANYHVLSWMSWTPSIKTCLRPSGKTRGRRSWSFIPHGDILQRPMACGRSPLKWKARPPSRRS